MKSILTITLNPTVDKSTSVDHIKPERKLRCAAPVYEPGGGGINVSRGLARLGVPSSALYTSGGRTGSLLGELLDNEQVTTIPVHVAAETRENFIVVDTANNEQYRFGMPGEAVSQVEEQNILKTISDTPADIAVISGSLPPGMGTEFFGKIITLLKSKGSLIIADTSGEALTEALRQGVYLLKPNLGELGKLSGKEELDNDLADDEAKKLIDAGSAEVVVVSLGPQGAYLVSRNQTLHVPAPSVKKLSTVGAGDSMVAGMVSVMAKGGSEAEIVRMGVACGSAATMNPGTGLFKPEDARRLFNWLNR